MSLFRNFFAGATDETDATPFRQPSNRKELFFLACKERAWSMVPLNLLYLLFCLPLILWCCVCVVYAEAVILAQPEDMLQQLLGVANRAALGMVPCLWIIGMANPGMAYVTRNWARDEHASVWIDFWHGIRKNWRQALPTALISALRPLIVYWYAAFLITTDRSWWSMIPLIVCALVLLLWTAALPTMYVMMVTYRLRLSYIVTNSLIMTIAHLPTALGVLLAGWIVPVASVLVILYLSSAVGALIIVTYLLLWGLSLRWLLDSSFANKVCQQYINARIGEPVNIGLSGSTK